MYKKTPAVAPVAVCSKWEDLFDLCIPWKKVFTNIYTTTFDVSIRIIQLKIIYNYLPTKKRLKKWGIQQCDLCRVCEEEEESDLHLFWYCKEVALFWFRVGQWISTYSPSFYSCPLVIMLGDLRDEIEGKDLNNIISMIGKAFIFKATKKNVN